MKKISVKANEEFRIKLINDFSEDEFFYNAFVKAKKELECIVNDTAAYHKNHNDTMFDFSNNIIAFSGDRGQGKSSAMLSFSNLLRNANKSFSKNFLGECICKNNYVVLDRIDPTKFENNDNILLIILAKVFNEFCELWKNSDKSNMLLYSGLLDQFQLCYDEIMTIKNKDNNENDIGNALDKLGRIGDSGKLKTHLWDLLQLFFKFKNNCIKADWEVNKNFLVIQLDDTDLNTDKAYTIVEDIRKYFMIPNVVILMAIDINQLTKAIEQYFINRYEKHDTYYGNIYNNSFSREHRQIAVKYIDKLVPGDRKVYLPKIASDTDDNGEKLELEYLDERKNNILDFSYSYGAPIKDVQESVLRLIYEKTGIVFVKPKTHLHDIIPKTMRELVNFLSVLNKMQNIENDYNDKYDLQIKLDNLKNFETFFVNVWIPNYVEYKYLENINNFITASWTTKSKQFVKDLKATIKPALIGNVITKEQNNEFISDEPVMSTIKQVEEKGIYSFADIRMVLISFEDEFPQEETYKFTFAIKTLYTIYLNKILCSQLINEEEELIDYDLLLDFLGGEIFSKDEINSFMRTDKNIFNRGSFEINSLNNTTIKNVMQKIMNESAGFISYFVDFHFPNSQEKKPDYKVSYKAANGVSSTHFKFSACSPILKLIYPYNSNNRLNLRSSFNNINYDYLEDIQHYCMRIVSNTDLINYLSEKLQDLSVIKSENWDYSEHLVDLFDRIEEYIEELDYFNWLYDFSDLGDAIKKYCWAFNETHKIYKYLYLKDKTDLSSELQTLKSNLDADYSPSVTKTFEEVKKSFSDLSVLHGVRSIENLKGRILSLNKLIEENDLYLEKTDLSLYSIGLKVLMDKLNYNDDESDAHIRAEVQSEYNQIVRDLKKEFEE